MKKTLRMFLFENLEETYQGLKFNEKVEKYFEDKKEELKKFIAEDPGRIQYFGKLFIYYHPEIIDQVIDSCFVEPIEYSLSKETMEKVPVDMLMSFKAKIIKKVDDNPMYLKYVPAEFQENFLQIPYEAVKKCPNALQFVPVDAMFAYPDICFAACKGDMYAYDNIPYEFVEKHPEIRRYSPYHQKA